MVAGVPSSSTEAEANLHFLDSLHVEGQPGSSGGFLITTVT